MLLWGQAAGGALSSEGGDPLQETSVGPGKVTLGRFRCPGGKEADPRTRLRLSLEKGLEEEEEVGRRRGLREGAGR